MTGRSKKGNRKTNVGKSKKAKKTVKPSTVFLLAFGTMAAAGGAYLLYDRIRNRRQLALNPANDSRDAIIINNNIPPSATSNSARAIIPVTNQFPLKRGSRGTLVTMLQQALSNIIGEIAMKANGGVDGQFGPGTANALKMAGYPEVVDEAIFNKITGRSQGSSIKTVFDAQDIANKLYRAAQSANIEAVIVSLQEIRSVTEYSAVNEYYKSIPTFISRTIVTDLLDYAFKTSEPGKLRIRQELLRIGLKVDGSGRWSLQGIGLYRDLITIRDTVVTDSRGYKIPVKRNTIVGDEIQVANGMTWFRSVDNGVLQVPTQDVKYSTKM
ncbi:hypothetical protein KK083_21480 [Fulvivirgaceae bacterium PWU4]|uniref:Peptidoglycan-binding protein n=1 Tax=Chryseosolibacter histidini TaxID=2782349 RepID=A0AAP2DQ28_9BACT|nr:hypothetical protein [Chryseosolibacter histidini]MBT1699484.1 hypothetical protein [Chryseosolibacter histidini]